MRQSSHSRAVDGLRLRLSLIASPLVGAAEAGQCALPAAPLRRSDELDGPKAAAETGAETGAEFEPEPEAEVERARATQAGQTLMGYGGFL
eukprot:scaffold513102_cov35-Prasinocladus_malaysianus.AAC.1